MHKLNYVAIKQSAWTPCQLIFNILLLIPWINECNINRNKTYSSIPTRVNMQYVADVLNKIKYSEIPASRCIQANDIEAIEASKFCISGLLVLLPFLSIFLPRSVEYSINTTKFQIAEKFIVSSLVILYILNGDFWIFFYMAFPILSHPLPPNRAIPAIQILYSCVPSPPKILFMHILKQN